MVKVEWFFGSLDSSCLPTFQEGFWSRTIFLLSLLQWLSKFDVREVMGVCLVFAVVVVVAGPVLG